MFNTIPRCDWGEMPIPYTEPIAPTIKMLGLRLRPLEVIEVRYVHDERSCPRLYLLDNDYFDDPGKLAQVALRYSGKAALYMTLNPVRRSLLDAASNMYCTPEGCLALERDVTRRCWLPIRFRSTVDTALVLARAEECKGFLHSQEFPEPVVANSHKGIDLLYAIDLPNDADSTVLIRAFTVTLADRFSDATIKVDTQGFLADLVVPVYGTRLGWGAGYGGPQTSILHLPEPLKVVDYHVITALTVTSGSVLNNNRVSLDPPKPRETRKLPQVGDWDSWSDLRDDVAVIQRFVTEECVLDPAAWTPTSVLYEEYEAFCYIYEEIALVKPHFSRALVAHLGVTPERHKRQGKAVRGMRGIRLRYMKLEPATQDPGSPNSDADNGDDSDSDNEGRH